MSSPNDQKPPRRPSRGPVVSSPEISDETAINYLPNYEDRPFEEPPTDAGYFDEARKYGREHLDEEPEYGVSPNALKREMSMRSGTLGRKYSQPNAVKLPAGDFDPALMYTSQGRLSPHPSLARKASIAKPASDSLAKYGHAAKYPHASARTLVEEDEEGSEYSYDNLPPARRPSYVKAKEYYDEEAADVPREPLKPYFSLRSNRTCMPPQKYKYCCCVIDPIHCLIAMGALLFAFAIIAFCMWPRIPVMTLLDAHVRKFEVQTGRNNNSQAVQQIALAAKYLQAIPGGTDIGLYGMMGTALARGPPYKVTQAWEVTVSLASEIYVDYSIDGMYMKAFFPTKELKIADQYLEMPFVLRRRTDTVVTMTMEVSLTSDTLLGDPVTQAFGSSCGLFPFTTFAQNQSNPYNVRMYYQAKAVPSLLKLIAWTGMDISPVVQGYFDIACPADEVKKTLTIK